MSEPPAPENVAGSLIDALAREGEEVTVAERRPRSLRAVGGSSEAEAAFELLVSSCERGHADACYEAALPRRACADEHARACRMLEDHGARLHP